MQAAKLITFQKAMRAIKLKKGACHDVQLVDELEPFQGHPGSHLTEWINQMMLKNQLPRKIFDFMFELAILNNRLTIL